MPEVITPGSTIGIVGGGQLGRMMALAAAALGYKTHIYSPVSPCPAQYVAAECTIAPYEDQEALLRFAESVDVVTFEFENIPYATLRHIEQHAIVRPNPKALHISQNRIREKDFVNSLGIATAPYRKVFTAKDLASAFKELGGGKALLKTSELGYDGKGQWVITTGKEIIEHAGELILEGFVPFAKEISVIVARTPEGKTQCFPPAENVHSGGILRTSTLPASVSQDVEKSACVAACKIADALDVIGLLAVEFFVTKDDKLLVNEIAPRPHNSGHWTMDACTTSQFEQHVRAICGLPLGDTTLLCPVKMQNLIGDEVNQWKEIVKNPHAKLHLYDKDEARPGRKMGHVNYLKQ